MGYSARYHAASLAAVFLALAVGILVGVGFGSDIVTGTAEDLERSLGADLDAREGEIEALEADLEQERAFGEAVYPAVVGDQLPRREIALIGFGELSEPVTSDVEAALGPSGAEVAEVAVIEWPADLEALASTRSGRRARRIARGDPAALRALGVDSGRLLVRGGPRFGDLRGTLLSRYSGSPSGIDGAIVAGAVGEELEPEGQRAAEALAEGLLAGIRSLGSPAVGVELSTTDPSTVGYFGERGLTTVDSVDLLPGRVALVYALSGEAEGSFGVKDGADSLLPDLLATPESAGQGAEGGGAAGG